MTGTLLGRTPPVVDDDDPLTYDSPPDVLWTRGNSSESLPGVLTPLTWSMYGRVLEICARRGFSDLGVVPWSATAYPEPVAERLIGVFAGRCSINVGVIRNLMGGLPGITGDDIERDMLGSVRTGINDHGYGWRVPAVLAKTPRRLALAGRAPARCRADAAVWWESIVDTKGLAPNVDARTVLVEAITRFAAAARLQSTTRLLFQGTVAGLTDMAAKAGCPELAGALLSGAESGAGTGEETAVSDDLWNLAGGRLDLAEFQRRHGYHCPTGGELAGRSWREDPGPVERLLPKLVGTPPPIERRERVRTERVAAVRALLAGLPRGQRPGARVALRMAPYTGLALERCKTSWLMYGDVVRAAARATGSEWAAAGILAEPDDAFHLFAEEFAVEPERGLGERLIRRRAARDRYQSGEIPVTWQGNPELTVPVAGPDRAAVTELTGIGVGGGEVTGRARVVSGPDDGDRLEPGDILVCSTTDPGWVSLMTVAGGLVIDIGGVASHGAVVAREIGIPCVIGTGTGTVDLRDGLLVRVDGARGRVEVLEG